MKYIRTKDGIFKVIKNDCPHYTHVEMKYTPGVMMHESVIEKSADAIKDLCDRFVLVDKNEYDPPLEQELIGKNYDAMFNELKFRLSEGSDLAKISFYGAIWKDEGLIYVAKMNEKGEFELL